jgi:Na+-driven multidrug efflux pump
VAFNTTVLYIKLLLSLIVGFFTTRLVLDALGQESFGIYSLVGGVIGMLAFLNSAMSNASMRFISYSLGSADTEYIRKIFNTSRIIHFGLGLLIVILMELGGLLMFEYLLNLPPDKVSDAQIVFHFMVVSTFFSIITVPYEAIINSHENMLALSIIDITGSIFHLSIAVYLLFLSDNLLVIYAFLMLLNQMLLRAVKQRYAVVKYDECKIKIKGYLDKDLFKKMLSFAGWNLFGSIGAMSVTQLNSILINMFYGVLLNAANGIAMQVSSQLNNISVSLNRAINPQIMKSEGGGDREKMLRLTMVGAKFSVFAFSLFALPAIMETPYLLGIWLKEVPDYAVIFTRLILVNMLLSKFTFQLTEAIRAVGQIRNITVTESMISLFGAPVAFLLFSFGYPPYSIFLVILFGGLIKSVLRLYFAKIVTGLSYKLYLKNNILRPSLPIFIAVIIALILQMLMAESIYRVFTSFLLNMLTLLLAIRFIGLNKYEYDKIYFLILTGVSKFKKKLILKGAETTTL